MSRRPIIDLTNDTPSSLVSIDLTTPHGITPAEATPVAAAVEPVVLFADDVTPADEPPRQRRRANNPGDDIRPVLLQGEYLNVEWPPILAAPAGFQPFVDHPLPHPVVPTEEELINDLYEIRNLQETGVLRTIRFNGTHPRRDMVVSVSPNDPQTEYARWGYIFLRRTSRGNLEWWCPMPTFINRDDDQYYIDFRYCMQMAYRGIHIDDARQFLYIEQARVRHARLWEIGLRRLDHN